MKLKLVEAPPPDEKLRFIGDRAPIVRGFGLETYHCAQCDEILLAQMNARDTVGATFRCPTCGAYNALDYGEDEITG